MKTLIVAFEASDIAPLAGFAQALGHPFDVLCVGFAPQAAAGERVFASAEAPAPADALAPAIQQLASGYTHVAAVSSMQSKDVMARLAGHMDAAMVTDVISVDSPTTFKRPIVAGTLIATVETLSTPVVFTVRPSGFAKVEGSASVESISLNGTGAAKRTEVHAASGSRPDLSQAKVVVSGGRPLKDAATFEQLVGGLADRLGGAVGATRAAVDSGIAPNECQVGQTGKIVAPDLYIAAGISGSTQHMAGIKDSKIIVAINKDPDAPIFEFADFGLVADLFDALPELTQKAQG
jgi:electron transfer flavoprotein alpha subunit